MYLFRNKRREGWKIHFLLNPHQYFLIVVIMCWLPNVFNTIEIPNYSDKQFFNAQKYPSRTDRQHKKSILSGELDYKAIYKRDDNNAIESNAKLESMVTHASRHNSGGKYISKSNYTFLSINIILWVLVYNSIIYRFLSFIDCYRRISIGERLDHPAITETYEDESGDLKCRQKCESYEFKCVGYSFG